MKTTLSDVLTFIGNCSNAGDLGMIRGAYSNAIKQKNNDIRRNFAVGDRVSFTGKGRPIWGVITGFNRKTISVAQTNFHFEPMGTKWRVSPSLLNFSKAVPVSSLGLPSGKLK